jgi:hypothetical protein
MEDDSETVYKTGIKLASPSVFDGDRRKAILWLKQVETYLTINERTYDSDTKKVAFALSYMQKGEAAKFAETVYSTEWKHWGRRNVTREGVTTAESYVVDDGPLGRWEDDFLRLFKAQFFPRNVAMQAADRLSNLKQTGSVEAYISIFRRLAPDCGLDPGTQALFFRKGLKKDLFMEIMRRPALPEDVHDWMDMAMEIESRKQCVYGMQTGHWNKKRDPYAMDVDRMDTGGEEASAETPVRQGTLSQGERDRRRRLGLCFKCGNKGLIKDCPNHRDSAPGFKPAAKPNREAKIEENKDDDWKEFLAWKEFKARAAKKDF